MSIYLSTYCLLRCICIYRLLMVWGYIYIFILSVYIYCLMGASASTFETKYGSAPYNAWHTSACVSIRQHTPAYASIRQHTSAYVSIRQHTSAYVSIRQEMGALAIRFESICHTHTHTHTHHLRAVVHDDGFFLRERRQCVSICTFVPAGICTLCICNIYISIYIYIYIHINIYIYICIYININI